MEAYDSTQDTVEHINKVARSLYNFAFETVRRGQKHDASKLKEPEKSLFDQETPLLPTLVYGSKEYEESLERLKPALDHHYSLNTHHPEHYEDGMYDMNLLDLVELYADWKAACQRTKDGDFEKSVEIGTKKYDMPAMLAQIFRNSYNQGI